MSAGGRETVAKAGKEGGRQAGESTEEWRQTSSHGMRSLVEEAAEVGNDALKVVTAMEVDPLHAPEGLVGRALREGEGKRGQGKSRKGTGAEKLQDP